MGFTKVIFLVSLVQGIAFTQQFYSSSSMKCSYGERGSLTATCSNITSNLYFKQTTYRFDHLDETLLCKNCTLENLEGGTFDISGNKIKELQIANSGIVNVNVRAFIGLVFLERLNMSSNKIKSIPTGTFTGVKKIRWIDLSHNQISSLSENAFFELKNLEDLHLEYNQLSAIGQHDFEGLEKLTRLSLHHNEITSVKKVFNISNLRFLDLRNNKINSLSGDDFFMPNLSVLMLGHNQIKAIPDSEFVSMRSLYLLDLSNNLIDKITPKSFEGLIEVNTLHLGENLINDIPIKSFSGMVELGNLTLRHNKLTKFVVSVYAGLPELSWLDLSYNNIADIDFTGIFPMHSLHSLDLSNNNLTDLEYQMLYSRAPRLSWIDLSNNSWPCSLQRDMDDFFYADNFKYTLFDEKYGKKCDDRPRVRPNVIADAVIQEYGGSSTAANVWIFLLLTVIMISLGVLFFIQYKLMRELKYNPLTDRRTVSQSNLISESRENGV